MHAPYRKILTETKLITCESPTTLDMRSRRIRHGNTQQRCLCASSICIREVFIEALSSRNFQSRTEFRSRSFLVASRKTHRPNVSASAVNLLRQKRKKRTLAETLTIILLPSAESFKKGCCQLQAKVCAGSTGLPLVQACPGKSVVR